MVFNCSDPRNAGDPALSFPKCCLRELRVRTRSPDDNRKLHVKDTRAVHKDCGQILKQVAVPLTLVFTSLVLARVTCHVLAQGQLSLHGSGTSFQILLSLGAMMPVETFTNGDDELAGATSPEYSDVGAAANGRAEGGRQLEYTRPFDQRYGEWKAKLFAFLRVSTPQAMEWR